MYNDNPLIISNKIILLDTTDTNNKSINPNGSVILRGGANLNKSLYIGDNLTVQNDTYLRGGLYVRKSRTELNDNVIINGLTYPTIDGTSGQVIGTDGSGNLSFIDGGGGGGGTGDVVGPSSATDNAITLFDGTTGKLIQNSDIIYNTSGILQGNNFNTVVLQGIGVDDYDNFDINSTKSKLIMGIDNDRNSFIKFYNSSGAYANYIDFAQSNASGNHNYRFQLEYNSQNVANEKILNLNFNSSGVTNNIPPPIYRLNDGISFNLSNLSTTNIFSSIPSTIGGSGARNFVLDFICSRVDIILMHFDVSNREINVRGTVFIENDPTTAGGYRIKNQFSTAYDRCTRTRFNRFLYWDDNFGVLSDLEANSITDIGGGQWQLNCTEFAFPFPYDVMLLLYK